MLNLLDSLLLKIYLLDSFLHLILNTLSIALILHLTSLYKKEEIKLKCLRILIKSVITHGSRTTATVHDKEQIGVELHLCSTLEVRIIFLCE